MSVCSVAANAQRSFLLMFVVCAAPYPIDSHFIHFRRVVIHVRNAIISWLLSPPFVCISARPVMCRTHAAAGVRLERVAHPPGVDHQAQRRDQGRVSRHARRTAETGRRSVCVCVCVVEWVFPFFVSGRGRGSFCAWLYSFCIRPAILFRAGRWPLAFVSCFSGGVPCQFFLFFILCSGCVLWMV